MADRSTPSSSSATGEGDADEPGLVATTPGSEPDTIVPVPMDVLQDILQQLSELKAERARQSPVRPTDWPAADSVGAGDGAARAERVADAYGERLRSSQPPPPPPQPIRSESLRLTLDPQKLQKGVLAITKTLFCGGSAKADVWLVLSGLYRSLQAVLAPYGQRYTRVIDGLLAGRACPLDDLDREADTLVYYLLTLVTSGAALDVVVATPGLNDGSPSGRSALARLMRLFLGPPGEQRAVALRMRLYKQRIVANSPPLPQISSYWLSVVEVLHADPMQLRGRLVTYLLEFINEAYSNLYLEFSETIQQSGYDLITWEYVCLRVDSQYRLLQRSTASAHPAVELQHALLAAPSSSQGYRASSQGAASQFQGGGRSSGSRPGNRVPGGASPGGAGARGSQPARGKPDCVICRSLDVVKEERLHRFEDCPNMPKKPVSSQRVGTPASSAARQPHESAYSVFSGHGAQFADSEKFGHAGDAVTFTAIAMGL